MLVLNTHTHTAMLFLHPLRICRGLFVGRVSVVCERALVLPLFGFICCGGGAGRLESAVRHPDVLDENKYTHLIELGRL